MPCLNEAETLAACIVKAKGFLAKARIVGEVIVADNGSTDGSQDIARRLGARVVDIPRRGYGAALSGGIEAARGKYVIMADADDSYDFSRLDAFLEKLRAGFDLVMGNRFAGGIAKGAMPWHHRYIGNPVLSLVGRVFFRTPIRDFHCGLRGFSRAAILGLNLRTSGMEFASEMVVKASLAGLAIAEVPTTLVPDGRTRAPHLRSFRDGWRHLRFLLLFSPRWLFLYPGLGLLAVGTVLAGLLLSGPVRLTPDIEIDIHTFLVAAMFIIVGMQAISFGLIGRRFASQYGIIPQSRRFAKVLEALTLERMLLAGLALIVAGGGAFVWGVSEWARLDFGALDPDHMLRVLILAMTGVVTGLQLMMTGFMSSIIAIPLEERRVTELPRAEPLAAKSRDAA